MAKAVKLTLIIEFKSYKATKSHLVLRTGFLEMLIIHATVLCLQLLFQGSLCASRDDPEKTPV